MPIDSPQAVKFSNEKIRVAANKLAQAYIFANGVIDEWNALGGVSLVPNNSQTISDSAVTDGRPIITGAMANNIVNRLKEMIADFEAGGKAKLNTILQVAQETI